MNPIEKQQIVRELRERLTEQMIQTKQSPHALESQILNLIDETLLHRALPIKERKYFFDRLLASIQGLDILEPFMKDPSVTEIMVNGQKDIFIEQDGQLLRTDLTFDDATHLQDVVTGLFSKSNKELSLSHPIADLRMQDGSRANAVLPPIAPNGPVLTIRKFTGFRPTPEELLRTGCISEEALQFLKRAVQLRKSLFICGGTGAGKTTFLNALSFYIPPEERIITIEDSAELQLRNQPNLVQLEARQPSSDGKGEVTLSDLIRSALRMRPDRIIVGEVRGDEAYMLVHAANTGHPGSLSTGHGNSCTDMILRLANMISGCTRLPYPAILQNLASTLDFLVQIKRFSGGKRRITEIAQVGPSSGESISLYPLFQYDEKEDHLYATRTLPF